MPDQTGTVKGTNGKWDWTIKPGNRDKITITFTPDKKVKCSNIRLAQIVTNIAYDANGKEVPGPPKDWWKDPKDYPYGHNEKDFVTDEEKHVVYLDHVACEGDPYYNGDDKGRDDPSRGDATTTPPKGTTLSDNPSAPLSNKNPKITRIVYIFETCAICADTGEVLGCFVWTMEGTAKSPGKITVNSKDKDQGCSKTFTQALDKFLTNHIKKGDDGKPHWYCPETSPTVKGPTGVVKNPFGGEVPPGFIDKWQKPEGGAVKKNVQMEGSKVGGGLRVKSLESVLAACLGNLEAAAVKFTWSGDQIKTRPSVVLSPLTDLEAQDIAPFIEADDRFSNDFVALYTVPVTKALMRDLIARLAEFSDPLVNSTGPVTVTLMANLRTKRAAALTVMLETPDMGRLMVEVAAHTDVDEEILETLHYLALNMGRVE